MVVPARPVTGQRLPWRSFGLTDTGRVRPGNEDALLLRPDTGIYAVADGMGGHAAGEVASRLAVDMLAEAFDHASPRLGARAMLRTLLTSFAAANEAILAHAAANPACAGMGTTLTALAPLPAAALCVVAHVGDSRCYRLRAGELSQLTHDHTWVQRQVDEGMLTAAQARHHPLASLLSRVLGTPAVGPADTHICDVAAHDLFLLCSDGLTGMLDDGELHALLDRPLPLDVRAHELVAAANQRGGRDNITVLLLAVDDA
jgi:PPM family protein phosphatase